METEDNLAVILFVCLFVFQDMVSLCSPGCPGTHSVDQAGLELGDLPASASQVLGKNLLNLFSVYEYTVAVQMV